MRTFTKKQLTNIIKICSKDSTRPVLGHLAVQKNHLVATDGYVAVAFPLSSNSFDDFILDMDKLKQKLVLMKPNDELTEEEFIGLKDANQMVFPDIISLVPDGIYSNVQVVVDPLIMAKALTALSDTRESGNCGVDVCYKDGTRGSKMMFCQNGHGDFALVMGFMSTNLKRRF